MKKHSMLFFLIMLMGILGYSNDVLAVVINFDSLTLGGIEGDNLGGVTVTSASPSTRVIAGTEGVGYRSPFNSITNTGFITNNPMTFLFDAPTNFVKFTGGDQGGDQDQFTVDLFDVSNSLLQTFTTPVFGGNSISGLIMNDFFTVELFQNGITKMVVRNAINAGIGIDDLEFGTARVPEPSTLLIIGFGIVGIASMRKKIKK